MKLVDLLFSKPKPKDIDLTWDNANAWEAEANRNKEEAYECKWRFDCNFKLDFDGSPVRVSCRFYPPTYTSDRQYWTGDWELWILGEKVQTKSFKEPTIFALREAVEKYNDFRLKALRLNG